LELKERVSGESVLALKDMINLGRTQELGYTLFEEGKKTKGSKRGQLLIRNCSLRKFFTFFDLYSKNGLNLVPVVAVDFSLANLTFDENCYCLHTLKPGQPNDYLECLEGIQRAFHRYSRYTLGYGFGARNLPGEGPSCDLLSMTGDILNPFISSQ